MLHCKKHIVKYNVTMKRITEVKTLYARIALVLLTLNFALTGYVVYSMNQTTEARLDTITSQDVTPTPLSVPERLDSKQTSD